MGAFDEAHEVPIIVRGEGCYVFDQHGRRYLDGLSALYCVNIGHGRADVAQAGADQAQGARLLHQLGLRAPEVDRARRAHRRPRPRRPQPRLLHVAAAGRPSTRRSSSAASTTSSPATRGRYKVISRKLAYHGTTMGALTATGIPDARRPFEPLFPGSAPRRQHEPVPARGRRPGRGDPRADRVRGPGDRLVRDPRARPELRRLLRPAATATSRGSARSATSTAILFISDEVICSWGRLGEWFGAERFGYEPDLITTAKGLTSSYAPMGAVIASDRVFEPFTPTATTSFLHGITFGGHPMASRRRARQPRRVRARGRCSTTCARNEGAFGAMLDSLRDIPIVGDVRGMGYFWAIELVKDRETKADVLRRTSASGCCAASCPPRSSARGLICRADDRGDPVDPARAAADRRPGAVRGDPRRAAAGPRGGLPEARACTSQCVLLAARPDPRPRRPARRRRGRASTGRSAGCTSPSSPTRRRGCRAASCCSRRG